MTGSGACQGRPVRLARSVMSQPLSQTEASDEADLLRRYAEGDPPAARLLAARLTPRIFGHAFRVLGNHAEAEDVAQEAMMRLWKAAKDWRSGEARVSTWVYRVTANLCIDRLRKRGAVGLDDIVEPESPEPRPEERLQQNARSDALQAALMRLPDRQRQAVVLRHIDGLANPEIAAILDIGVEAVESLTARGKRALKQALESQRDALGFDDD